MDERAAPVIRCFMVTRSRNLPENLGWWVREKIEQEGLVPPLYCVMVGTNGAMLYWCYDDEDPEVLEPKLLGTHGEKFVFPVHVMLLDASGECKHYAFTEMVRRAA